MADEVQYVITIRSDGKSSGGKSGAGSSGSSGGVAKTTKGESAAKEAYEDIRGAYKGAAMASAAITVITNRIATAYVNTVELRTGNSVLQQRMAYNISCQKRAVAIGASIIGGFATGNVLAIAAGVGSAISWGVDYSVEAARLNLQRRVEDIGIGMANRRAGAGGDRLSRLGY